MKLHLTRRAARDLEDIAAYIRARNPAAAHRVRDALQAALQLITIHPYIGNRFGRGRRGREVGFVEAFGSFQGSLGLWSLHDRVA